LIKRRAALALIDKGVSPSLAWIGSMFPSAFSNHHNKYLR
jgi:hypothetical protein